MEELVIKGFTKVDESTAPENLDKTHLTQMVNMVLDKKTFNPVKRHGFTRFNENACADQIKTIFDVVDESNANYILSTHGGLLQKSLNGTGAWSSVKTGLTGGLKHKIASYLGRFILTNGSDPIYIIGDSAFASNWNLEIAKPDITAITSTHGSFGDLTASSRYKYILVYATEFGEMSEPSIPFTHYMSGSTADSTDGSNKQLRFDGLPVPSDTRVTYKMLFRTQADGEIFYYLKDLSKTDTYFEDRAADSDLDLSQSIQFITNPIYGKSIAVHRDRLFIGNYRERTKLFYAPAHSKTGSAPLGWNNGVSLSIASGTGGNMTPGDYEYLFVFVDKYGAESEGISATVTVSPGHGSVTISNAPALASKFTNDIEYLRIYRTISNGSDFYKLIDYDADAFTADASRTTTDDVADNDLSIPYLQPTKDQISGILYSEIGKPSETRAINSIEIPEDEITAIYDDNDGLLIFKNYSIWKIYTQGSPQNWVARKIVDNIGCTEPDAICKNGSEYFFISNKTAYLLTGETLQRLSDDFQTSFSAVTSFNSAGYIQSWYVLGVTAGDNYLYVFDTKLKTWYKFTIAYSDSVITKKYGTNSGTLLIADNTYVVKYDSSVYTDNQAGAGPAEFSSLIRTKTFTFNDGISRARLRKFYSNYNKVSETDFKLVNPDSSAENAYQDGTGTGWKLFKRDFGSWTTNQIKKAAKFYIEISGGLKEFGSLKIRYRITKEEGNITQGSLAVTDDLGAVAQDDKGSILQ